MKTNKKYAIRFISGKDISVIFFTLPKYYSLRNYLINTFDISILRLNKGVFEVLATGGDSSLGGDDMDHALGEWIIAEAGFSDVDTGLARRILLAARAAKEDLTRAQSTRITIDDRQHQWSATISRERFDELIQGLVAKTLTACRRALRDAAVNKSEIGEVVIRSNPDGSGRPCDR